MNIQELIEAMDAAGLIERSMMLSDYLAEGGRTHTQVDCRISRDAGAPANCVIHNPSTGHRLYGRPQILRSSGLIEEQCEHGVGHPNPDSAAFMDWRDHSTTWGVHGCDGCCGMYEVRNGNE